jgi:hypothetical protein
LVSAAIPFRPDLRPLRSSTLRSSTLRSRRLLPAAPSYTMPTTRATPSAPLIPLACASTPSAAHANNAALADDNYPIDVDLSVIQFAAANTIDIQLLKISTSPSSSDTPHDDRLRNPQNLAATTVSSSSSIQSLTKNADPASRGLHLPSNYSRLGWSRSGQNLPYQASLDRARINPGCSCYHPLPLLSRMACCTASRLLRRLLLTATCT